MENNSIFSKKVQNEVQTEGLKQNQIPLCNDIFCIILSMLDLKSLKNFSLSCRKHYLESNNTLVWKNQMVRLCPAFSSCYYYCEPVGYKKVVKNIIELNDTIYCDNDFSTGYKITFLEHSLSRIIVPGLQYGNVSIKTMLTKYIKNNLNYFNNETLNIIFNNYYDHGNIEMVEFLLDHSKYNKNIHYSIQYYTLASMCIWGSDLCINEIKLAIKFSINYYKIIDPNEQALINACSFGHIEILKLLLDYYINYTEIIKNGKQVNMIFIKACSCGTNKEKNEVEIVKLLFEYLENYPGIINIGAQDNEAFIEACSIENTELMHLMNEENLIHREELISANKCNHTEIVKLLLNYSKNNPGIINPGAQNNRAFINACKYGFIEIVKLLLNYSGGDLGIINPGAQNSRAFISACSNGIGKDSVEIVKLLLNYSKNNPSIININAQDSQAFIGACGNGCVDIVKLLLTIIEHEMKEQLIINPWAQNNLAFILACKNGTSKESVEIVKLLLEFTKKHLNLLIPKKDRFTILKTMDNRAFISACSNGKNKESAEIVKLLLDYLKEFLKNKLKDNNFAFSKEKEKDDDDDTQFLKEQIPINPDAQDNEAFILACKNGRTETVKLLLDFAKNFPKFIDPGARNNEAFILACKNGYTKIIKLLLEYSENYQNIIYPGDHNNEAFVSVYDNRRIKISKLLLNYSINHPGIINSCEQIDNLFALTCELKYIGSVKIILEYLGHTPKFIKSETYCKAFIFACSNGDIEIVKLLLEYSTDGLGIINHNEPNNEGFTLACKNGHTKIVKLLIGYSKNYPGIINFGDCNNDALVLACENGHSRIVELLLSFSFESKDHPGKEHGRGYRVRGSPPKTQFKRAEPFSPYSFKQSLNIINPGNHINNAFVSACKRGYTRIVKLLLNYSKNNPEIINIDSLLNDGKLFCNSNPQPNEIILKLLFEYSKKIFLQKK
jgi:ankyrin repeat protein